MCENKNPEELTVADVECITQRVNRVWREIKKRWNGKRRQDGALRCPYCLGIIGYEIESDGAITAECLTRNCINFQQTGRPTCVC